MSLGDPQPYTHFEFILSPSRSRSRSRSRARTRARFRFRSRSRRATCDVRWTRIHHPSFPIPLPFPIPTCDVGCGMWDERESIRTHPRAQLPPATNQSSVRIVGAGVSPALQTPPRTPRPATPVVRPRRERPKNYVQSQRLEKATEGGPRPTLRFSRPYVGPTSGEPESKVRRPVVRRRVGLGPPSDPSTPPSPLHASRTLTTNHHISLSR